MNVQTQNHHSFTLKAKINQLPKNHILEEGFRIALSDASPEQKKKMFELLQMKQQAEGLKAQLETAAKIQEKQNEDQQEESETSMTSSDGDQVSISTVAADLYLREQA
jgi:hypothetical protein